MNICISRYESIFIYTLYNILHIFILYTHSVITCVQVCIWTQNHVFMYICTHDLSPFGFTYI